MIDRVYQSFEMMEQFPASWYLRIAECLHHLKEQHEIFERLTHTILATSQTSIHKFNSLKQLVPFLPPEVYYSGGRHLILSDRPITIHRHTCYCYCSSPSLTNATTPYHPFRINRECVESFFRPLDCTSRSFDPLSLCISSLATMALSTWRNASSRTTVPRYRNGYEVLALIRRYHAFTSSYQMKSRDHQRTRKPYILCCLLFLLLPFIWIRSVVHVSCAL